MAANPVGPLMSDRTPERSLLGSSQLDRLADALLALSREVWVLRDRQILLEEILAQHGIDAATAIDAIEPDAVLQARLDSERDRLIGNVIEALGADGRRDNS